MKEGFGRKHSWSTLCYYPGIYLEGLKVTLRTEVRIANFQHGSVTSDALSVCQNYC